MKHKIKIGFKPLIIASTLVLSANLCGCTSRENNTSERKEIAKIGNVEIDMPMDLALHYMKYNFQKKIRNNGFSANDTIGYWSDKEVFYIVGDNTGKVCCVYYRNKDIDINEVDMRERGIDISNKSFHHIGNNIEMWYNKENGEYIIKRIE